MGRYATAFPFTFNNAPGDRPASELDDNFNAVNSGYLTIRAQELSDGVDYDVVQDDEFSFFVCKGVDDFQIIPPVAPPAGFGFFVSNETQQDAVQINLTLCCTIFVGPTSYSNPTLIGDFPPYFFNVKGGLIQYDGNNYQFYPLFFATGAGGGVQHGTVNIIAADTGVVITHGLNQAGLTVSLLPKWNTAIYQTAQTDTTVTFEFSNPAPANLTLDYLLVIP